MANPQSLRFAITSGGLVGPLIIHALLLSRNLDRHNFEAAVTSRGGGARIGFHGNAIRASGSIGPAAVHYVECAGALPLTGLTIRMAVDDEQSRLVGEAGHKGRGFLRSVARGKVVGLSKMAQSSLLP